MNKIAFLKKNVCVGQSNNNDFENWYQSSDKNRKF